MLFLEKRRYSQNDQEQYADTVTEKAGAKP